MLFDLLLMFTCQLLGNFDNHHVFLNLFSFSKFHFVVGNVIMAPISAVRFYHKNLVTVIPSNNVDSDGSSSDNDEVDGHNRSYQPSKKKVLVTAAADEHDTSSSDESTSRWPMKRSGSFVVLESSEEVAEKQVILVLIAVAVCFVSYC